MKRNFRDLLAARWAAGKFVCVGLDSEEEKIPKCVKATASATASLSLTPPSWRRLVTSSAPTKSTSPFT